MKRVLVASGKGGAGRTSLTANLTAALAADGDSVFALDLDMTTPALDLAFGEEAAAGWGDLLEQRAEFAEASIDVRTRATLLPYRSAGLMSAETRAVQVQKVLEYLQQEGHEPDWVLMDAPAGPQPEVLKAASLADLVLFVLTPEPASLAASFVLARNMPPQAAWAVVVNQADSARHAQAVAHRFDKTCAQFLSRRVPLAGYVRRDERAVAASREMRLWDTVHPAACVKDIHAVGAKLESLLPVVEEAEVEQVLAAAA